MLPLMQRLNLQKESSPPTPVTAGFLHPLRESSSFPTCSGDPILASAYLLFCFWQQLLAPPALVANKQLPAPSVLIARGSGCPRAENMQYHYVNLRGLAYSSDLSSQWRDETTHVIQTKRMVARKACMRAT